MPYDIEEYRSGKGNDDKDRKYTSVYWKYQLGY